MGHCISHEQCPKCAKLGRDRGHNNLAVYDDGSKWCFSCGYYEHGKGLYRLKKETQERTTTTKTGICLPSDVDGQLPQKAWDFLGQYALTELDIKRNTVLWSDYWQRLIFPIFDSTGLLAWQGRYLGSEIGKAKWFSQGDLKGIIHIVGNKQTQTCVLTEDLISAIKVSHNQQICAMPLFGSHVATKRLLQLTNFCNILQVKVWLDFDKAKESMQYAKKSRDLGINTESIITPKDPKCYSDMEIKHLLRQE